jgi:hypothetical protein
MQGGSSSTASRWVRGLAFRIRSNNGDFRDVPALTKFGQASFVGNKKNIAAESRRIIAGGIHEEFRAMHR